MSTTGTLEGVELILWNMPDAKDVAERPTIEQTRNALDDQRIPSGYAEDIADTTAFRRAAAQCRQTDMESRCFKGADGELYCQIDRLKPESDSESARLVRTLNGVWRHTVSGPKRVRGYDSETHAVLTLEYERAKATYEYGDIGRMLQVILTIEGIGVYSPRKAGGIYFAPTDAQCADLLDRVERFCLTLGIRFLRYTVPDSEHHRHEVGEAIAAGLAVDIAAHREAVEAYSVDTRPEAFNNRRGLMLQSAALIGRLRQYLNGHAEAYGRQLGELELRLQQLERDQQNAVPTGRRVLVAR